MKSSTYLAWIVGGSLGSSAGDGSHFGRPWLHRRPFQDTRQRAIYQLTDRLHGDIAHVAGNEIAATVSSWLADLGAQSPLVDELARAVQHHDWPVAYAIGETLSVDVAVAS
jgi:hypothetical protein